MAGLKKMIILHLEVVVIAIMNLDKEIISSLSIDILGGPVMNIFSEGA